MRPQEADGRDVWVSSRKEPQSTREETLVTDEMLAYMGAACFWKPSLWWINQGSLVSLLAPSPFL